jgi:hypothetical protein
VVDIHAISLHRETSESLLGIETEDSLRDLRQLIMLTGGTLLAIMRTVIATGNVAGPPGAAAELPAART